MSSEIAVRAERLGKSYSLGSADAAYGTLRDSLAGLLARDRPTQGKAAVQMWALRDVSFQVKRGEVLGIVGRNGAGKSTLLKILSRVTDPSEGEAWIGGRVGSLLEVGTGFHPELTGRENIFLNGAIMGMARAETARKFDEIVAFAEMERFLDTPVKRYSSGMYMRLAFSVAAHLEPEVLIIDEVLAVGDAAFQRKCLGKMDSVSQQGRTVLFVSHNMAVVGRLCSRTVWLDQGRIRMDAATEAVISLYLTANASTAGERWWSEGIANSGVDEFAFEGVRLLGPTGEPTSEFELSHPIDVEITYEVKRPLPFCRIGFLVDGPDGTTVLEVQDTDQTDGPVPRVPGRFRFKCRVPGNLLNTGRYTVSINAGMPMAKNLAWVEGALAFTMNDSGQTESSLYGRRRGVIRPSLDFSTEPV